MTLPKPTAADLQDAAFQLGAPLDRKEAERLTDVVDALLGAYRDLDGMADLAPPCPVRPYGPATRQEDPYHAWEVRTSIKKSSSGPLSGKTVGIKDSISVAGLPMSNGTDFLEGFIPGVDATVVQRVLDAGAEIVGKNACEYLCLSGGSHTSHRGPTHNPHRLGYSSGGSSSGSAVAVARGECDMALGSDQAGSIRMPAAWSGVVGLKPTYGLVPYSGILQIATLIDHVGPLTRTVRDNALLLEAIAGDDAVDSRQKGASASAYSSLLESGITGLRVGLVVEGFGRPESEAASDAVVREAARILERLGARVSEVSIPMHSHMPAIWSAIASDGFTHHTLHGAGFGYGFDQLILAEVAERFGAWTSKDTQLSITARAMPLASAIARRRHGLALYSKALAYRHCGRKAYDDAFQQFDLLLMPTMPMKAQPLPAIDAPPMEQLLRTSEMIGNTCAFNVTHHPALSIPCGMVDGLPIGLMLIGRHFDEATLYRAGHAFEQTGDWKDRSTTS